MGLDTYNGLYLPYYWSNGFGGKEDLREIICPESYGGVTFDLWPLVQDQIWSLIPIMAYISLTITRGD